MQGFHNNLYFSESYLNLPSTTFFASAKNCSHKCNGTEDIEHCAQVQPLEFMPLPNLIIISYKLTTNVYTVTSR